MDLRELIEAIRARLGLLGSPPPAARSGPLILIFNTMWGQLPDPGDQPLPDGYEITADKRRWREAAATVFHIPTLRRLPRPVKQPGQLWVAWSMECEVNYPELRDPAFMRPFDLTMTYRLDSDVPVPYTPYYGSTANFERALRTPPPPKVAGHLAALFISSRIDRSGRLAYAADLMRHLEVHSYGRTLRNRTLAGDQGRATKLDLIGGYRFTLAFENAIGHDYVTEKFYDPLVAGSVPVYLGAPNVEAFAPGDRCFINAAAFAGPRALAAHLLALAEDDAAYAEYLAWKQRPLRPAFRRLLDDQRSNPSVRLCRVVGERQRRHP